MKRFLLPIAAVALCVAANTASAETPATVSLTAGVTNAATAADATRSAAFVTAAAVPPAKTSEAITAAAGPGRPEDSVRMYRLQEIEVTATRASGSTPVAYTDLSHEVIARNSYGFDIPSVLALTPSMIATNETGIGIGGTSMRLRGTDATRLNVTINVVLYYAPRIFAGMGASGDASMLQTVVMGVVNILFTVVAIFTVDRVGRKPLLIVGSAGMMIGMAALAALSFTGSIGIAALVFIIIYTASFMMSWGPICWVLISEIFPNTIRSQAVAVAVAAQWISNFLVSATFPSLSAWSVGGTYCIYALMSLASALFVWKWVPETKGKTLEEMSKLWRKNGD